MHAIIAKTKNSIIAIPNAIIEVESLIRQDQYGHYISFSDDVFQLDTVPTETVVITKTLQIQSKTLDEDYLIINDEKFTLESLFIANGSDIKSLTYVFQNHIYRPITTLYLGSGPLLEQTTPNKISQQTTHWVPL